MILNTSSLPQDLSTTSTPQFLRLGLGTTANASTDLVVNGTADIAGIVLANNTLGSMTGSPARYANTSASLNYVWARELMGAYSISAAYYNVFGAGGAIYFCNGNDIYGQAAELTLSEDAANVLQLGADATTPAAQAIQAADGSGTDKNGGSLSLKGGQSTGQGRGGFFAILTSLTSSTSNSTANSYSTRWQAPAKHIDLTNDTNITILTITLSSGNYIGGSLIPTIFSRNLTDHQCLTSRVLFDCVNTGSSGIATNITQVNNNFISSISTGFVSGFYTVAGSGDNINIFCSGKTNLTPTVFQCKLIIDAINSNNVATITEF